MVAHRLPDGRDHRLRRQRRLLPSTTCRRRNSSRSSTSLGNGWRQPGSAFKPFNYVTGIDNGTMTAASMFMDVTTTFDDSGARLHPKDCDLLERGPLRMRTGAAILAQHPGGQGTRRQRRRERLRQGPEVRHAVPERHAVGRPVTDPGHGGDPPARPGRRHTGRWPTRAATSATRRSCQFTDATGKELLSPCTRRLPATPAVTPQAAYIITNILAGNTDPKQNPFWGDFAITDRADGTRRPATFKTGTNNDAKDLVAFGYLAAARRRRPRSRQYALVVGGVGRQLRRHAGARRRTTRSSQSTWPRRCGRASWTRRPRLAGQGLRRARAASSTADVDAWSGGKPTAVTRPRRSRRSSSPARARRRHRSKVGMEVVPTPTAPTYLWDRRLHRHARDEGLP